MWLICDYDVANLHDRSLYTWLSFSLFVNVCLCACVCTCEIISLWRGEFVSSLSVHVWIVSPFVYEFLCAWQTDTFTQDAQTHVHTQTTKVQRATKSEHNIWVFVCLCVYMWEYVYARLRAHAHAQRRTHTCVYVYLCACATTWLRVCAWVQSTHTHTHTHTLIILQLVKSWARESTHAKKKKSEYSRFKNKVMEGNGLSYEKNKSELLIWEFIGGQELGGRID